MNQQTVDKVEIVEKRAEAPKAPLFVRHLQRAKLRTGVRSGIQNLA